MADEDIETALHEIAIEGKHGVYIPVGALWGAEDIRRMADSGALEVTQRNTIKVSVSHILIICVLQALTITMTKHPASFRVSGLLEVAKKKALSSTEPTTLYDGVNPLLLETNLVIGLLLKCFSGGVRSLCHLAPNNVNTMAAAAIAAHNLGFDKVIGRLVADPK